MQKIVMEETRGSSFSFFPELSDLSAFITSIERRNYKVVIFFFKSSSLPTSRGHPSPGTSPELTFSIQGLSQRPGPMGQGPPGPDKGRPFPEAVGSRGFAEQLAAGDGV